MTVPPLLVILGPTASGKSALAVSLARRLRAEILSVDSMQIYHDMNIGTAKPSLAERHEIPHHLIDWLRPDELFSAARFVELADHVIADAARRSVPLIATGGTPMYFKALVQGLFEGPGADEAVRDQLRSLDNAALHARLAQADPPAAARIHLGDRKRMIRALEVFQLTGQPISQLQKQWEADHPIRHQALWVGLKWDRDKLNQRINSRVKDMLAAGWLDEVRALVRKYPRLSQTAAEATGYNELIQHLKGELSLEEAAEQIKIATRQLARRQMKWFRRFPGVTWIEGDQPMDRLVEETLKLSQPPA